MGLVKELYNERKNKIIELLTLSKDYYDCVNKKNEAEAFEALIQDIKQDDFKVVVVGEFSSGKSTFLNALMRDRYLPSFSNETTATINYLRHISKSTEGEKGIVYYTNGEVEKLSSISFEEIEKYVSTKSEIKVASSVNHLDLYLESRFLKDGVTLVDSPGLNGVADYHREKTEQQINKSHASIFIFSAEQPGRKTDFEFIKELKTRVSTIIFVLNKIDCIKASEQSLESVIETLKTSYKSVFPEETTIPKIWPVAAYPALVARASSALEYHHKTNFTDDEKKYFEEISKMNAFEERLWKFLTQSEKAKQQLLAPVEKIINLLRIEKDDLEEEKKVLEGKRDSDEINEGIFRIEETIRNLNDNKGAAISDIAIEMKKIERNIREKAEASFEKLKNERIRMLSEWDDLDELDSSTRELEKVIDKSNKLIGIECSEAFHEEVYDLLSLKYYELRNKLDLSSEDMIEIHMNKNLELNAEDISFGIEEYTKDIARNETEIEQLMAELDNAELSMIDAMKKEDTLKQKRVELKEAKDRKEVFESQIYEPSINYRQEQREETKYVDGFLGTIWHVIVKPKTVIKNVTIADTTERDTYNEKVKQRQEKYDNEINELSRQYDAAKSYGKSVSELEVFKKQLERKLKAKDEKLSEARKEFRDSYNKKYEKQLKKIREEIEAYIDDVNTTLSSQFRKELKKKREAISGALTDIITKNLEQQLTKENKRLENLNSQLNASESQKNNRMSKINEQLEKIRTIMSQAVELQCDIETTITDKIEHDDLY